MRPTLAARLTGQSSPRSSCSAADLRRATPAPFPARRAPALRARQRPAGPRLLCRDPADAHLHTRARGDHLHALFAQRCTSLGCAGRQSRPVRDADSRMGRRDARLDHARPARHARSLADRRRGRLSSPRHRLCCAISSNAGLQPFHMPRRCVRSRAMLDTTGSSWQAGTYSLLCLQFANDVAELAHFGRCANEKLWPHCSCANADGRSEGQHRSDALYCDKHCATSQAQRKYPVARQAANRTRRR